MSWKDSMPTPDQDTSVTSVTHASSHIGDTPIRTHFCGSIMSPLRTWRTLLQLLDSICGQHGHIAAKFGLPSTDNSWSLPHGTHRQRLHSGIIAVTAVRTFIQCRPCRLGRLVTGVVSDKTGGVVQVGALLSAQIVHPSPTPQNPNFSLVSPTRCET
jgi:hypothetical protein